MFKRSQSSFADIELSQRREGNKDLSKIDQLVNWELIKEELLRQYPKKRSASGRLAYCPLLLFKMLLLQRWYNLSDEQLELSVLDRLSFISFAGLSLSSDVPDATTICRFRKFLLKKNLLPKLLDILNQELNVQSIEVKSGVLVDASIISSSRRPRKSVLNKETTPSEEPEPEAEVEYSEDKEASFTKKGKKILYGFKVHAATTSDNGFVLGGHVTTASRHESQELEQTVEEIAIEEGTKVYADKGYASKSNREMLSEKKLEDGIMHKAVRGKPLTKEEKESNKKISKNRYKIERLFGTLKRTYNFSRARYLGIAKVELEFFLNSIAFNIRKAMRMIIDEPNIV